MWLNISMDGSTQYFNVYNTPGYSPNGDAVMWVYDNFSSSNLDTSKWTSYKKGSRKSTVDIQNGQLILSGAGVTSSANVVLNKPFTNGIELAVNETISKGTSDVGTYSDASFGSGPLAGVTNEVDLDLWHIYLYWLHTLISILRLDNMVDIDSSSETGWWHTVFSTTDGSFQSQGISRSIIWVNSSTSDAIMPNPGITLSEYTGENLPHTVAYSYDTYGNANMSMLNVNQNRLPLSIPDPYGCNQFNNVDIYYNSSGVFGHNWWMLITTHYMYSDRKYENACLYYSDDGLLWYAPPGVTNPIGKSVVSKYDSNAYGSDPDLVYNPTTGKFMCYYVIENVTGNEDIKDLKVRTYDGNTVSPEMKVITHGISPTVLYDNTTGIFYMWTVDTDSNPNVIYRYTSTDGVNFSNKQAVGQSSDYETCHINMMNHPKDSKLYALFTFTGNNNLYLATTSSYTDNFTIQKSPILRVDDSSSATHKNIELSCSAGIFSNDGNILKLWITAKDINGVWTAFYTQATQANGIWKVGNFTTLHAPVMTVKNEKCLNTSKQWMLSQGDYVNNKGVIRKINEIWGYKIGHTPKVKVTNMGTYMQIEVVPTDSRTVTDYQVMIPASFLDLPHQNESLDIERVPNDSENVTDTHVMAPASLLNLSSQSDSQDSERVQSGTATYPSKGVINWKRQNWYLTGGKANPGNNYWNISGAWIDNQDRMHLTIVKNNSIWECTMLSSQNTYHYGTFTWTVASPVYTFDKNSAIGLCTYLDDNNASTVGISRWGDHNGNQLWYSIEPSKIKGNSKAYLVPSSIKGTNTTYRIEWKPNYIRLTSMQADGTIIADYNNTNISAIPQEPESVIMNLWLMAPPSNGKNIELIISNFTVTND
ncbi:hypothetical protein [Methanosarcina barkeri]|uniref:hypothetical protein n=1 Tax=Methanosarcina barkeri TaxID=2208 RepID=UPI0012F6A9A3|nr:hypothetical protein [Methanosarcina barkeri]